MLAGNSVNVWIFPPAQSKISARTEVSRGSEAEGVAREAVQEWNAARAQNCNAEAVIVLFAFRRFSRARSIFH